MAPAEVGRRPTCWSCASTAARWGCSAIPRRRGSSSRRPRCRRSCGPSSPASATEERIDCLSCWEIARSLGMEKIAVAAACERLGLKVRNCQIGAF